MSHITPRPEDAARYLLKEERDYDVLERIYALEARRLSNTDAHIVQLIRTQLEADWRTPLLAELDRLLGKYGVGDAGGDTGEVRRQSDKERAVLIALRQGMALIRRDLEVHGLRADGTTTLISQSANYDDLWSDALRALADAAL